MKLGTAQKKTGKRSWKPASPLDVHNKDPNFHYKWVLKDSANIDRHLAESWTFAQRGIHYYKPDAATDLSRPSPIDEDLGISNTNSLGSLKEYRESVLMILPNELADERYDHYQEQADRVAVKPKDLKKRTASIMHEEGMDASNLYEATID